MKKRVTLWSILILALVAGGAYSQGTLIKRFIGSQDVNWAQGGSGAREVFTYTTPQGYVLTLNKPDATDIKYRAIGAGSVEGSATADIVPEIQSYASLSAAVTAIGSNPATIKLLPGIYPVTSPLTISGNISIKPERGAILNANNAALTIQGPIEAGPYQIFSWTGTGAVDISGSPTKNCYFQWWGAQAGTAIDNSAILLKAFQSMGSGHHLRLTQGQWGILTPTVIGSADFGAIDAGIIGEGNQTCQLYINTPGAIGVTFGTVGSANRMLKFKDISVTGPTSACTTALRIYNVYDLHFDEVNFFAGSTDYVAIMSNCLWTHGRVLLGSGVPTGIASLGQPTKGFSMVDAGEGGCNATDLDIQSSAWGPSSGPGTYSGCSPDLNVDNMVVGKFHGSLENFGAVCLSVSNSNDIKLGPFYTEVGGTVGPGYAAANISNCGNVSLEGFNDGVGTLTVNFAYCRNSTIDNCVLSNLTIDNKCQGTRIGTNSFWSTNPYPITDNALDTIYTGPQLVQSGNGYRYNISDKGNDNQNLIYNSSLASWVSTTKPDFGVTRMAPQH